MEAINISKESLDAFRKEKKLIPAPIDNKNVTTDWIEEVFDYQTCIWGKRESAIGFIHDRPVVAEWSENNLFWKFVEEESIDGSDHLEELRKRLKVYDDANPELVESHNVIGNYFWQKFYWKNED